MKNLLIVLVLATAALAQTKPAAKVEAKPEAAKAAPAPAPKYEMTELESLRLLNVQKDIEIENNSMQQLNDQFSRVKDQQQTSVQALQKLLDDTRAAHKWDKDVQYNFQSHIWEKAPIKK